MPLSITSNFTYVYIESIESVFKVNLLQNKTQICLFNFTSEVIRLLYQLIKCGDPSLDLEWSSFMGIYIFLTEKNP